MNQKRLKTPKGTCRHPAPCLYLILSYLGLARAREFHIKLGRCQNSRYLHGQTRVLPLSSTTCPARTSPSTILRHRPPVTRS